MEINVDSAILFELTNILALAGWMALIFGILADRAWLRVGVAGRAVPAILSVLYAVLVTIGWPGKDGGYNSIDAVARLFQDPHMLLAGWTHYLAFDLLIGGWIADEVDRRGLTRWLLLPTFPLTFLFGPIGLLVLVAGAILLRPAPRDV
jgi:hypothetical protein